MRLAEFLIACTLIEITPGPNMGYLAAIAMTQGIKPALSAVLGVAIGLATLGIFASFGLSEFLNLYPMLDGALRWCGVAFMLWLAGESWWQAKRNYSTKSSAKMVSFWRGLTNNILNLKSVIFYVAVIPEFIDKQAGHLLRQNLSLVAIYVALATCVHVFIIFVSGFAGQSLLAQTDKKYIGRLMAVLLAGVALWLAIDTLH